MKMSARLILLLTLSVSVVMVAASLITLRQREVALLDAARDEARVHAVTLQIALETLPEMETRAVRGVQAALKLMADTDNEIVAIVTDMNMPRRDGFDLLGQIRADERHRRLPIVMVSGDSDPRLPERALASGASAFFSKPYSPLALRRTLEKLL